MDARTMRNIFLLIGALILGVTTGCQDEVVGVESSGDAAFTATSSDVLAKVGFGMIWADEELFRTVGTPTSLPPDHGPFDKLYQAGDGNSFKDMVGAISESKPGDQDWNGGRWDVYVPKEGVMTDYSNADSVEDLDLNDFESAGVYLECPLTPRRGRGHN
jgi:hypothetical protein